MVRPRASRPSVSCLVSRVLCGRIADHVVVVVVVVVVSFDCVCCVDVLTRKSSSRSVPTRRYILVYPQGCDVSNHLSLFLCVADYDKLLPGMCMRVCSRRTCRRRMRRRDCV